MEEMLWNDVKKMVEEKIRVGNTLVKTKSQGRKFRLVQVTHGFVRVKRERSSLPFEDIPKDDFIDLWIDLNKPRHAATGYAQRDLHDGQNRHSALLFALAGMLPYVKWKRIGRAWKLVLGD